MRLPPWRFSGPQRDSRSYRARVLASRRDSHRLFERLEDRTLLSIGSPLDYGQVSPIWFEEAAPASIGEQISADSVSAVPGNTSTTERITEGTFDDQWIVRLTPTAVGRVQSVAQTSEFLNRDGIGFQVVRGLGLPGQLLVRSAGEDSLAVEASLRQNPNVASFGPNRVVTAQVLPDDPLFAELWGLNNTGQTGGTADADINAPEAWDITHGSAKVVVAVIDSGIDYTHEDLYLNVWINQGEIPATTLAGLTDVDSDGLFTFYDLNDPANQNYVTNFDPADNDYIDAGDLLVDPRWADGVDGVDNGIFVDDLFGWDFTGGGNSNNPIDQSRHGTHVAGTIGAAGNNTVPGQPSQYVGVTGVNWVSSMMALKFLDGNNRGTVDDAIRAINYATMMRQDESVNVRVANNSWGYLGSPDEALRTAIQLSGEAGILFVAAAGNGDSTGRGINNDDDPDSAFYPASYPAVPGFRDNIISVAATDDEDRLARFSNYGPVSVDIAAPGVDIFSTDPGDNYRSRYGTSMATPHVSGVAALVWANEPDATVEEVREAIHLGGQTIGELQVPPKVAWGNRLDAFWSLQVDTVVPEAAFVGADDVTGPGVAEVLITVDYTDNRAMDDASMDGSDLVITRLWNSTVLPSSLVTVLTRTQDPLGTLDNTRWRVVYRLQAPDGTWGALDDGDYEVAVAENQVHDQPPPFQPTYNYVPPVILGTFNVDSTPGLIRVDSTYDAIDNNLGDGVSDDGTGHSTLRSAIMEANFPSAAAPGVLLANGPLANSVGTGVGGADESILQESTLGLTILSVPYSVTGGYRAADDFTVPAGHIWEIDSIQTYGYQPGAPTSPSTFTSMNLRIWDGAPGAPGSSVVFGDTTTNRLASSEFSGVYRVFEADSGLSAYRPIMRNTLTVGTVLQEGTYWLDYQAAGSLSSGPYQPPIVINGQATTGNSKMYYGGSWKDWSEFTADPPQGLPFEILGTVPNTIRIPSGNYILSLPGAGEDGAGTGDLDITDNLIIRGAGADTTIIDAAGLDRVFHVLSGVNVYIAGVTITGGNSGTVQGGGIWNLGTLTLAQSSVKGNKTAAGRWGGGLSNGPGATANVDRSTFLLNSSTEGGAIDNESATLNVTNSTFSANTASSLGGAINNVSGTTFLFNSTIANNTAGATGGGIMFYTDFSVMIRNTIVAGNTAPTGPDVADKVQSLGHNLIGNVAGSDGWVGSDLLNVDPLLGPLQDNGGTTFTHALPEGSPAVDAGDNAGAPATDQRGIPRPQEAGGGSTSVDIGAVERYYGQIHGVRFDDADGDGVRDPAELPLANATVYLDLNYNGQQDSTEPSVLTNAAGMYDFTDLPPGVYSVVPEVEPGWRPTFANYGSRIERGNVAWIGEEGNGPAEGATVSDDGRFVAFTSAATNLVVDDTNNSRDVFVYDRQTRRTERVSVASDGTEGDGWSAYAAISGDGNHVAFISAAANLVPGDTNGYSDVFVYNRLTGKTTRVSVRVDQDGTILAQGNDSSSSGYEVSPPAISHDGSFVAFATFAWNLSETYPNTRGVFVWDRATKNLDLVSVDSNEVPTLDTSTGPDITPDGRFVVFWSFGDDLDPGDTNGYTDVFVRDRTLGITELASVKTGGVQIDTGAGWWGFDPVISDDGNLVFFAADDPNIVSGDTNAQMDIFRRDRAANTTIRVSLADDGVTQLNGRSDSPTISGDGNFLAFRSDAANVVSGDTNRGIFVRHIPSDYVERMSVTTDGLWTAGAFHPQITNDGQFVLFDSVGGNFVDDDTNNASDVFVRDWWVLDTTERVSLSDVREEAESAYDNFLYPLFSLSATGRYVAFQSTATNLIVGDTNHRRDVFVFDRQNETVEIASLANDGSQASGHSSDPSISADGRYVAFVSYAVNLIGAGADLNGLADIFIRDMVAGKTTRIDATFDGLEPDGASQHPVISADGRFVVFQSEADNLVDGDGNGEWDLFLYDRQADQIRRVSVSADGAYGYLDRNYTDLLYDAAISADGRHVAFQSNADNMVPGDTNGRADTFVYDRIAGSLELIPDINTHPAMSADGRYLAFTSYWFQGQGNGHYNVFVYDRQTGLGEQISNTRQPGVPKAGAISADGRFVSFSTDASDLGVEDTNGTEDVYVYDRKTGTTTRLSENWDGSQSDGSSNFPEISMDGRYVAFFSDAYGLVPGDTNQSIDVFVTANPAAWQSGNEIVLLGAGRTVNDVDFGNLPLPGEIHGRVFNDQDGDGFADVIEPGLADRTLYLDLNGNRTLDGGEPSAVTDGLGRYSFTGLDPFKTYAVAAVQEQFWVQTSPKPQPGDPLEGGGVWVVYVDAGEQVIDLDFAHHYRGPGAQDANVISGFLFNDRNANGRQDSGELPLRGQDGWAAELYDSGGALLTTTPTDDVDGSYSFVVQTAGSYTVRAVIQPGYTQTTPLENTLVPTPFGAGSFFQTQAVAVGDFDNDGDQDVAVTHGEYLSLMRNDGSGSFAFWQDQAGATLEIRVGAGAFSLVTGDFDHDGDLDLATISYNSSQIVILENQYPLDPPFSTATSNYVGTLPRSLTVGQFDDDNGDGRIDDLDDLDLAVAHENGPYADDNRVSILKGNGDGTFGSPIAVLADNSPSAIVAGYFNGDDAMDLAVANSASGKVTILLNNGSGSFLTRVNVPAGDAPAGIAAGDLDRDGDVDLAVVNFTSADVSILVNVGNGSFSRLPNAPRAGVRPQSVIAVDLEGDGDLDLLVTNDTDEHLGILRNVTDPATHEIQFTPLESLAVAGYSGGPSYSVAAGHFNADQALDLAVAVGPSTQLNSENNYVSVVINSVAAGAHHVSLLGDEAAPNLNFGIRTAGDLPAVVGRHVFYNNSWYDTPTGLNPGFNDDTAIATDKTALLPGQTATLANYTSYDKGINGIMVDIRGLADPAAVGDGDFSEFEFKYGNDDTPDDWLTAPAPLDVDVRDLGDGIHRVTIIWADNAIPNKNWVRVTVKDHPNTGLVADDVFYFGNAIGDSGAGNPPGVATTFVSDELGTRPFFGIYNTLTNPAPVEHRHDYNRDGKVWIEDQQVARNPLHQTNFLTGLKLIGVPPVVASAAASLERAEIDAEAGATVEPAVGTLTIHAGDHVLLPDTPDQPIEIYASGGDAVDFLALYVQIADGGSGAGGTIDGPEISGADLLTGTIFSTNNSGQFASLVVPQVAQFSTSTSSGTVVADGILATVTIDTTGFFATDANNPWTLWLKPTLLGDSSFPGVSTIVVNGTITISGNRAPTDISLDNGTVPENEPAGTLVGTLSTDDPDTGDSFAYSLVAGAGDTDNGSFQIVGDRLETAAALDFETQSSYSIRLRSDDQGGLGFEKVFTITVTGVNEDPTADAGGTYSVAEGASVMLDASGSSDPEQLAGTLTYAWDFDGDGQFDDASGIAPTFSAAGLDGPTSLTVALQVTDDHGASHTDTATIDVTNAPPVADAGGPYSVAEGGTLVLGGSATDPAGVLDPLVFAWDFDGDGQFDDATGAAPTFSAAGLDGPSSVSIALRVTDDEGAESTATVSIDVTNLAPTADAGGPYSVAEGGTLVLGGSATDPAGVLDPLVFAWDFDGDGQFDDATGATPTFSAAGLDGPGSVTVALRVTDDDGSTHTSTADVAIQNANPLVIIDGAPVNSPEGTPIHLTSRVTDPGVDDTHTYAWTATKDGDPYDDGNDADFIFTPNDNGLYAVTLTVTDNDGGTGQDTRTIQVINADFTVTINGAPGTSPEGTRVDLTGTVADAGSADTHTFEWAVTKNGNPYDAGSEATFSFTPDDNGLYVVTLTVTDDDGGTGADSKAIQVGNVAPTAAILDAPAQSAEGTEVVLAAALTDPGSADTHTFQWAVTKNGDPYHTGSQASFGFTPDDDGLYEVTLSVTDDDGGTGTDEQAIQVDNVLPTAAILGAPAQNPEGSQVSLTSTVTDPGAADTHAYDWAVTKDGSPYASGTDTSFTFTPDDDGSYVATLTVTDDDGGMATDSVTIAATNVPPQVALNGAPQIALASQDLLLSTVVTDPGSADTQTYQWEVTRNGAPYASGSEPEMLFHPAQSGTYVVEITVRDDEGAAGVDAATILVEEDLGSVDFVRLSGLDPSAGTLFYRMETTHAGLLTLEAAFDHSAGDLELRLFDSSRQTLLTASTATGGTSRLDWQVVAGQIYSIDVTGAAKPAEFRVANLLDRDGATVTVHGTAGDDQFAFNASSSRTITINGVAYHFDDGEVNSISFDGGEGHDTVVLEDSPGDETLTAGATHALFTNAEPTIGFSVEVDAFEEMYAYARAGGHDAAYLHDSDAADKFKAELAEDYAKMYGGRMYNRVKLFDVVEAFSSGQNDLARIFDTAGDDVFVGQKDSSRLYSSVFDVALHDFRRVIAYATLGGYDEATLEDSALDDEFHGKPHKSELFDSDTDGSVYRITARRFDRVNTVADTQLGGYDRAKLWETARDDLFTADNNWARLGTQSSQLETLYEVMAYEFVRVRASSGGNDTAQVGELVDFDLVLEDGWQQP